MHDDTYHKMLNKLCKLMAMAERGNSPREQAIAQRQAEALMRRHGIDRAEVVAACGPEPQEAQAVWEDMPDVRADPRDRPEAATRMDRLSAAIVAQWAVRLSWLLILFVPVSDLVVSTPPPGLPNAAQTLLQLVADAWTDAGLLAAVLALLIGAVAFVAAVLWSAFWAFSLGLHAVFWDLTDWSKFAMGPDLWHIPIAAALGALVAFASAKIFGYRCREEHPVVVYAGLAAIVAFAVVALLMTGRRANDDD